MLRRVARNLPRELPGAGQVDQKLPYPRGCGGPHSGSLPTRNLAGTGLGDIDPFRNVSANARLGIYGDPLTQRPHRIDGGCFARWLLVRHRPQPRDRQHLADAEFARAPGGDIYVRGTVGSVRDSESELAEHIPRCAPPAQSVHVAGVGNANFRN